MLTNASGSLRSHQPPGSLMLISDHINAPQRSPLTGLPGSDRFCDMSVAYDAELRQQGFKIAREHNMVLTEGVYVWAVGPHFETPAEIRMFAAWGADAVGMSTVPETILARHAGLRVAGLALITNMAAGMSDEALTHALTLQQAKVSGDRAAAYLGHYLASLATLESLKA
ncbi:purine-nucleoside phosphorylase [Roseateles sp. UC29_93]|uniref:purine-nucleoside phosphorylase n=1 Tax=Roseateles sp. UC29_93 TaxID=3350177 RepID=UPI0036732BDF